MEVFTNNWNSRKYQIGYALSGGFIKGFAHLGVMQALLEHDIKPEIISGVSAGALAGVFYADGNEPHKVLDYFSGHKFQDLTKLVIPKKGLFDLCEFIDFLRTNLKAKNLEELQLPLIITATDLDHGRMVHFHRGSIAERVAASCCMPVMFSPNHTTYTGTVTPNWKKLKKSSGKAIIQLTKYLVNCWKKRGKYGNNLLSIRNKNEYEY